MHLLEILGRWGPEPTSGQGSALGTLSPLKSPPFPLAVK